MRAIALHAAATLARYERHVRRLAATWLDMDLYHTVSAEVDDIGRTCTLMPDVRVSWVALLVSHAELVHSLWRTGEPAAAEGAGSALALQEHLQCIDSLARRCLWVAGLSRHAAVCD